MPPATSEDSAREGSREAANMKATASSHNAVVAPTTDTVRMAKNSTPMTRSGNPIATPTPTCLIGSKLSDWLFIQLFRRRGLFVIRSPLG